MSIAIALKTVAAGAFATLLCTACAVWMPAQVGQTLDQVRAQRGAPSVTSVNPDGSTRWVYASAPFGQVAYAITASNGKVTGVAQVLTSEEFARVRIGEDDRNSLLARFGPLANTFRLTLTPREVWSYRMKQDDVFPILMHVQFDPQGVVRELVVGPDPLADPGEFLKN